MKKITNAGLHIVIAAAIAFITSFALKTIPEAWIGRASLCVIATVIFAFAILIRELIQAKNSDLIWERYWRDKWLDSVMDSVYSIAIFFIIVCVFTAGTYAGNTLRP